MKGTDKQEESKQKQQAEDEQDRQENSTEEQQQQQQQDHRKRHSTNVGARRVRQVYPAALPQPNPYTIYQGYAYPYDSEYMEHQQHQQQWGIAAVGNPYWYHYPLQQMEGVPLPPGIPGLGGSTDPLEAVLGPFPCARLRNLPYDVSLEDILGLFQGLVVIDVVIIGGGEAFVIFANPMDFQMGLQRNRQTIGRRFIEIGAASRSEYYEAVATVHEQERGPKHGLQGDSDGLRRGGSFEDHPPGDTASTVAALWGSGPAGVHASLQGHAGFGIDHGIGLHEAFGRSNSGGSRGALHAPPAKRTGGGIQIGEHTGYLRMRGLPFSAAKEDIFKFFVGYNPILDSIVLTYRNDGRATGEAYIGFASAEDAERAMALHRRSMGTRYIELFISNKDEQGRALARFGSR